MGFDKLRGLTSKVSILKHLTSAPFYKAVEGELKREFDARFEYRRNYKYAVFSAKPLPAPLAQHLEPRVIRRKGW